MAGKKPPEPPGMQKRAIATRQRFLEATRQCLAEKGYAATTTQEICRRLNVSRGTLLHHFSTREDLIIEAVEYILGENVRHFTQAITGLADRQLTMVDIARNLWEEHWTSPTCYAWLELVVASRTDPVLNSQVRSLSERWTEKFNATFKDVMGRDPDGAYWLFFLVLNALSIETIHTMPERVNGFLDDLLAVVAMADRLFIQYPGRSTDPDNKPKGKTDK